VGPRGIDAVAFYDKPVMKFTRLMKTHFRVAPKGFPSFLKAVPLWLRQKLWIPYEIEKALSEIGYAMPRAPLYFTQHHESHAASAFYPSPLRSAVVLTMDGVGEWATSSIGVGRDNHLELIRQLRFPHSLGLLYSAFTYFTGFKVNSGEYKLMGLAPYGEPKYVDAIFKNLLDLREDGSFRMHQKYFNYMGGLTMTSEAFAELFGGPPRKPETAITKREMDLARSIQVVTEEIVIKMVRHAVQLTGETNLCLAGGVALNCVANGRLLRENLVKNLWIQPAAGDAGGALGCALYTWHQIHDRPRTPTEGDQMEGSYLGPSFSDEEIRAFLDANSYPYEVVTDDSARGRKVAELIANEKVVGLLLGRMEFGPRALGHRSIIGDARSPTMQSIMNLKIKYRESFRPFAPSVLREDAGDVFDLGAESPYMLLVAPVSEKLCRKEANPIVYEDLHKWVNDVRSDLPAITHVDYSARVQTVSKERNPGYYEIIKSFKELTGVGVIINTSFNVRGEPIVCTPEDAYRCFMRTKMDYLVLEHCILDRGKQPKVAEDESWKESYVLD
jgi:carbamoyltransferase